MKRREFLILASAVSAIGPALKSAAAGGGDHLIVSGPASNYAADGVYSAFRDLGFFLVRREGKLFAVSSHCTHRSCKVKAEQDHTFLCPCHGSTFGPDGKVLTGPASKNLPILSTAVNGKGHLTVNVPSR
jgi:Rieske Fe-S protein